MIGVPLKARAREPRAGFPWRVLRQGEVIRNGDEYFGPGGWTLSFCVGMRVGETGTVARYRRRDPRLVTMIGGRP